MKDVDRGIYICLITAVNSFSYFTISTEIELILSHIVHLTRVYVVLHSLRWSLTPNTC